MHYFVQLISRSFAETWDLVIDQKLRSIVIAAAIFGVTLFLIYKTKGSEPVKEILGDWWVGAVAVIVVGFVIFLTQRFYFTPRRMTFEFTARAKSAEALTADLEKSVEALKKANQDTRPKFEGRIFNVWWSDPAVPHSQLFLQTRVSNIGGSRSVADDWMIEVVETNGNRIQGTLVDIHPKTRLVHKNGVEEIPLPKIYEETVKPIENGAQASGWISASFSIAYPALVGKEIVLSFRDVYGTRYESRQPIEPDGDNREFIKKYIPGASTRLPAENVDGNEMFKVRRKYILSSKSRSDDALLWYVWGNGNQKKVTPIHVAMHIIFTNMKDYPMTVDSYVLQTEVEGIWKNLTSVDVRKGTLYIGAGRNIVRAVNSIPDNKAIPAGGSILGMLFLQISKDGAGNKFRMTVKDTRGNISTGDIVPEPQLAGGASAQEIGFSIPAGSPSDLTGLELVYLTD